MKLHLVSTAAVMAALAAAGASGATTIVSGAYLVQYTSNCQAVFNELASGKAPIDSVSQGHIEEEIGTVTFSPGAPGGVSGAVTLNLQTVAGDSVVMQHNGVAATGISAAPESASGTYVINGNIITIVLSSTDQASFQATFGEPKAGIAQSAVILKQPASGDTCIESAVLLHQ